MKRQRALISAAAVVIAAGASGWLMARGGSQGASAAQIVQRAAAAEARLASGIAPGTTLHIVTHEYDPGTPPRGIAFAYPVRATIDQYQAFGSDGKLSAARTIATDDETGAIFATTELVDGVLIDTDVRIGTTHREPIDATTVTAALVAAEFANAESESGTLVNAERTPRTTTVDGVSAYLIERVDANGRVTSRSYIDTSTYRELKWENVGPDGSVTKSGATPVFESLPGKVLPTPAPAVATAIAGAQIDVGAATVVARTAARSAAQTILGDTGDTLTVDAVSGGAIDSTSSVSGMTPFDISVALTAAPDRYSAFQARVTWNPSILDYTGFHGSAYTVGTASLCGAADFTPDPGAPSLYNGCARSGGTQSNTGLAFTWTLNCIGNGTTTLHLQTDAEVGATLGTNFVTAAGQVPATTQDATITCSGLPTPTPTPEPTATPTP